MKNMYFLLLLSSFLNYSQTINFDEMVSMEDKNVIEVRKLLSQKGWYLFSELKPTQSTLGCDAFALEKERNNTQDFRRSGSFITYYYSKNFYISQIEFITSSKEIYNSFLNRINQLNYNLKTVTNSSKTYENNKNSIEIHSVENVSGEKNYTITVENKSIKKN